MAKRKPADPRGPVLVKVFIERGLHKRLRMAATQKEKTVAATVAEALDKHLPKFAGR